MGPSTSLTQIYGGSFPDRASLPPPHGGRPPHGSSLIGFPQPHDDSVLCSGSSKVSEIETKSGASLLCFCAGNPLGPEQPREPFLSKRSFSTPLNKASSLPRALRSAAKVLVLLMAHIQGRGAHSALQSPALGGHRAAREPSQGAASSLCKDLPTFHHQFPPLLILHFADATPLSCGSRNIELPVSLCVLCLSEFSLFRITQER